jgi:hypothetical protein
VERKEEVEVGTERVVQPRPSSRTEGLLEEEEGEEEEGLSC